MIRRALLIAALALAPAAPAQAGPGDEFDLFLLRELNDRYNPPADAINRVLSEDALVIATPMLGALALGKGQYRVPIRLIEAQVVAYGMSEGLKLAFQRPRPFMTYDDVRTPNGKESTYSLPSTHATLAFAGAAILSDAHPAWTWPAYGWATLVSLSRIYNGVHYPSDVLAGALVGLGAARLSRAIFAPFDDAWGPALAGTGLHPALTAEGPAVNWSMAF